MLPLLPLTRTQDTDNNEKKLVLSIQKKGCTTYSQASVIGSSAYIGNKPCAPPTPSSTLLTRASYNTRANDLYFKGCGHQLN